MTMLDTVVLNIPQSVIRTTTESDTVAWSLQSRTSTYSKYTKNPPRGLRDGVYRPRLTGMRRSIGYGKTTAFVRIEFSVAKLAFGNNLDEVSDKDFQLVISRLYDRLAEYGVIINKKDLVNASVAAFHPSKNIVLSDGYTASLVSRELAKININKKFDLTKTSFRNDGQSLQGYTKAHAVVVYDKVADLSQTKKRAVDKDPIPRQLMLFQKIKAELPSLEILRLEIRLTQKQKINSVMKKLDLPENPTFEQVFKKNVCQKIVLSYWNTIIEGENLFLFGTESNPKGILKRVLRKYPKLRAKDAVYLVGLSTLCTDEGGIRELRTILQSRLSQRGWYRFTEGIAQLNEARTDRHLSGWIKQIRETLRRFNSYRIRSP